MRERPDRRLRRTGMRHPRFGPALGLVAVLVVLAGCGDQGAGPKAADSSSSPASACPGKQGAARATIRADLDGDGRAETVEYAGDASCGELRAQVGSKPVTARVPGDEPLGQADLSAVRVPGREGELVLTREQHPRGGFQARLFGYADGRFAELTVDGQPVFGFIATDATSSPTAATCTDGGFVVAEARAHQPIGIMPAWDVYRTTYAVDGNDVTRGATTKVADNVLDRQLHRQYAALVEHRLFADCVVSH